MSEKVYVGKKGTKVSVDRASRSKITNRKPPNRHSFEGDSEDVSRLAKKLKTSTSENDIKIDSILGYRIINFIPVFMMLAEILVCKCGERVSFSESNKRGLGFKIVVTCKTCGNILIDSSPIINGTAYDINQRLIFAMRLIGIGYNGIEKFCAFMCFPKPVFKKAYTNIVHNISIATDAVRTVSLKKAADEEKKKSEEQGQTDGLTVSGGGSWRKRGFSSLFGFASLSGWITGKVIDILVKSKYCKQCEYWMKKSDTDEYAEWYASHEPNCDCNHTGSAGKMEPDAVVEMFSRSEALHNVKYAHYVGDGDSKTHKSLVDAKPYGDFTITKKECIGHVQKRMGTRLRNLKKEEKNLGGRGMLTGKLIDELSIYYGLAIRRNTDSIENMRKEICATLYHKISTDEKPQHDKCPEGVDSWCSWQKSKALNLLDNYVHKPAMSMNVFDAIQKIYKDLTREDLLSRCLGGYTQNANESLNSIVWSIAPKTVSSGKLIIDIATNVAVITYNDGFTGLLDIMATLGLKISNEIYNFCTAIDERRVKAANRSASKSRKYSRKGLTSLLKEADEENVDVEGMLFGPGIAD